MAGRRSLSLAVLLLALVAVVALASRAHTPTGGGGSRSINGSLLIEYVALVAIAITAVAIPVFVWTIWRNRNKTVPDLPARDNWMKRLLVSVIILSLIAVAYAIYRSRQHEGTATPVKAPPPLAQPKPAANPPGRATERFDWVPAIVVFTTVAGGAAAAFLLLRRRRAVPEQPDLALQLSDVLDDSLDDLRAEADPRRAVIAAYARMESTLALAGLPRRAAEAPFEYLSRVLHDLLSASAASVERLTRLFAWAKFSQHRVDRSMKDEAIAALVAVRDELREAAR